MKSEFDVAWAKALLKQQGLRSTAARIAVLQSLARAEQPVSHADVVASLSQFGFDQSTIFRALNELSEANVVARLDLGDQVRRFELRLASEGNALGHPHFMCVDCGQVTCLNDYSVQLKPIGRKPRPPVGRTTEVLLKGHCETCQPS